MKKTINILIGLASIIFLFSCNKKKEDNSEEKNKKDIELTILTDKVFSNYYDFSKGHTEELGSLVINNKIQFKLENNTDYTYVFFLHCFANSDEGCVAQSFPNPMSNMAYSNLIIKDNKSKSINYQTIMGYNTVSKRETLGYKMDSIAIDYYKKMGYEKDEFWITTKEKINKSTIMIPPNETLFLETFISFPDSKPSYQSSNSYFSFNKKDKYDLSLIFYSDTEGFKKFMTKTDSLNFLSKKKKLFSGSLISKNSIPLIINDN